MQTPIRSVFIVATSVMSVLTLAGVAAPAAESSRAVGTADGSIVATGQAWDQALLKERVYRDLGKDPGDLHRRSPLDLRRSFRSVEVRSGRRVLRVEVQGEGAFKKIQGSDTFVMVRLDTRGDKHSDYGLKIFLGAIGNDIPPFCYLRGRYQGRPHFTDSGGVACVVKMRDLKVSHRVNWRLASAEWAVGGYHYLDYAPNSGWYS